MLAISVARVMKATYAYVSCDSSWARCTTSAQTTESAPAPGAARSASSPGREIQVRTGSTWIVPRSCTPVARRRSITSFAVSRAMSASTRSPGGTTEAPSITASALTVGSSLRAAVTAGVSSVGE